MQVIKIKEVGKNFVYQWPDVPETFEYYVEYISIDKGTEHTVKIGFGKRSAYGKNRARVVVWIDNKPCAEFVGADDFEQTGEVLSEIRVPGNNGWRICRYPDEVVPDYYSKFHTEGLSVRVQSKGVHNAWAVVANISDHKTFIEVASLKRAKRK